MTRLLLSARYVTFSSAAILLICLAWAGKRVTYEQSIKSFFADDDPYMVRYQQVAEKFGDDNFAFLVYDDPELVTPAGLDRVRDLVSSVKAAHVPGVERIESLDAMPLLWAVDDALLALDRMPEFARKIAKNAAKQAIKNIDPTTAH